MEMTNTLAYNYMTTITVGNSFMKQDTGLFNFNIIKNFLFRLSRLLSVLDEMATLLTKTPRCLHHF
jgi:hypothetical protein